MQHRPRAAATRRRRVVLALAALPALGTGPLLGGCAILVAPQSAALRRAPPADLPRRAEVAGVPFHPQTRFHCGPAALATVLGHLGRRVAPDALADEVYLPAREGSLQVEVLAAARRHGAPAVPIPPRLDALLRELAAGRPVLLLQNLGLEVAPRWHYAVAVGYDLDADEIVLRSGEVERERIALPTFELTWQRGGHWAFVAVNPGDLPVGAEAGAAVESALAFERVAPPASALPHWRAVAARWPGNLVAALGWGNALMATGDALQATRVFEAAAARHDSAAAWNNLAHARLAQGDRAGARSAAQRALARAQAAEPRFEAAVRATLQQLGD
jgi:tetratricopeptide (TPR) repeat protein